MLTPRFPIGARVLTGAGFGEVVSHKGEIRGEHPHRYIFWRYEIAMRDGNALITAPEMGIEVDPRPIWTKAAAQKARLARRRQRAKQRARRARRIAQRQQMQVAA